MEVRKKNYTCDECGFYHDCPIEYNCPAKEMIEDICSNEGAIFAVIDGSLIGICEDKEGDKEE